MTKAVLFDWFATLADYEPPRHKLYCQAFDELGIHITPETALRGVVLGDEYIYSEHIRSPLSKRTLEERLLVYLCFPRMILREAKISAPDEVLVKIRDRIRELFKPEILSFVLFDDVLPTLKALKERGLTLGVVTNMREDMNLIVRRLGLEDYFDFTMTSDIAGIPKPYPGIFEKALVLARAEAKETVYVGDQHNMDVVGARSAGISPILLDRCNLYAHITDCPRINSLHELEKHI